MKQTNIVESLGKIVFGTTCTQSHCYNSTLDDLGLWDLGLKAVDYLLLNEISRCCCCGTVGCISPVYGTHLRLELGS